MWGFFAGMIVLGIALLIFVIGVVVGAAIVGTEQAKED